MTSSDVSINPYIFDHPALPELEREFAAANLPIQPERIGFRLLEDYFGDDMIEFKLDLGPEAELKPHSISPEQSAHVLRVLSLWRERNFPHLAMMVSF